MRMLVSLLGRHGVPALRPVLLLSAQPWSPVIDSVSNLLALEGLTRRRPATFLSVQVRPLTSSLLLLSPDCYQILYSLTTLIRILQTICSLALKVQNKLWFSVRRTEAKKLQSFFKKKTNPSFEKETQSARNSLRMMTVWDLRCGSVRIYFSPCLSWRRQKRYSSGLELLLLSDFWEYCQCICNQEVGSWHFISVFIPTGVLTVVCTNKKEYHPIQLY